MNTIRYKLIAHIVLAISVIGASSLAVAMSANLLHPMPTTPSYVVLAQQAIANTKTKVVGELNRDIHLARATK